MAKKIKRISYKNKTIGTFLGITLLVLGVTAGVVIAQNPQIFTPKAAANPPPECAKYGKDCVYDQGCIWDHCLKWKNDIKGGTCTQWGPERYDSCGSTPGGGSVCIRCYSDTNKDQSLYGVSHVSVVKTSATAALVTWTYGPGGTCTKRGSTIIFIGTNKNTVANNCGFKGTSVINDNSTLPAGCSWVRKLGSDATSYDTTKTSAGVNPIVLNPKITYYFRVVTRYMFTDSSGEDSGSFCGASTFIMPTPTPIPPRTPTPTPKVTPPPTPTVKPTVNPTVAPTPTPVICKNCQYQADLFWGPVIQSYASGIRYSTSQNHRLINSTNNYSSLPGCKLDPAPILPDPILPVFTPECADPANKGYLTGSISTVNASSPKGYMTATVRNNTANCTYPVGFASYKANGTNINIQNLYDTKSVTLGPGQTAQMNVGSPMNPDSSSCHSIP